MAQITDEIGFIGLGNMGVPMAHALIDAGFKLVVYNRTSSKAQPHVEKGARLASTVADAVPRGGIVITMVSDDAALEAVVGGEDGVAARLGSGGVHVSMSTVSPITSRAVAKLVEDRGGYHISAPVFGRPERAAARQLWIIMSGAMKPRDRVKPLFAAMGQKTYEFGEDPGAANIVKLINNFMITSAIEVISEGLALAEKNNIDPKQVASVLGEAMFNCPLYKSYFDIITNRRFTPPGFRMELGLKDIDLVISTATDSRVPMPMATVIHNRVLQNLAKGRGDLDWAAVALGAFEDAGLKV